MSPAKKAKALARLKRVRPKATGGTTSKSLAKGGGGGGSSPATGSTNRSPKIGASYQATRAGVAALSPVTEVGLLAAHPNWTVKKALDRKIARVRANPSDLIGHEIVVGADVAVDKKMGQAAAISRGSVTAIAPEVYTAFRTWEASKGISGSAGKAREAHRKAIQMQYGYDPNRNIQDFTSDPDTRTYRFSKHGGQLLRWARGKSKFVHRATEPVQKLLGMLGGTI